MLRVALAFSLLAPQAAAEPPADAEPPVPAPAAPPAAEAGDTAVAERGTIVFGPGAAGGVRVIDSEGTPVATLTLRHEQRIAVDLPVGRYRIEDTSGEMIDTVDVAAAQSVSVTVPPGMEREALPVPAPIPDEEPTPELREMEDTPAPPASPKKQAKKSHRPKWKRWATPLFSALTPGVGQLVNREPGKGIGFLLGSVTLGVGALSLWFQDDPTEGATRGEEGRSNSAEVMRLGTFAAVTGALQLLWAGGILDAHAVARDRPPAPKLRHKLNVDVTRFITVGFRPHQPAYELYRDWSLSVMGQPVRRFSVGITDMSVKLSDVRNRLTLQGGVRLSYRVFDRRRLWLALGIGSILQGSVVDKQSDTIDPVERKHETEGEFGAVPYGQFEMRIFLLDRWSLNVIPRLSVPVTTRYYSGNRALPRFATTFELGTGIGVYF